MPLHQSEGVRRLRKTYIEPYLRLDYYIIIAYNNTKALVLEKGKEMSDFDVSKEAIEKRRQNLLWRSCKARISSLCSGALISLILGWYGVTVASQGNILGGAIVAIFASVSFGYCCSQCIESVVRLIRMPIPKDEG